MELRVQYTLKNSEPLSLQPAQKDRTNGLKQKNNLQKVYDRSKVIMADQ
jgi:hypothetical protein